MPSSLATPGGGVPRPARALPRSLVSCLLPLLLPTLAAGLARPDGQPNLLLVVADDLGVDMVGAYAEGAPGPPTPTIDSLAQQGVLFRNCWSNTMCSPTRATIQTGRYGFRTGIGMIVTESGPDLQYSERILPEYLVNAPGGPYACAAIGKWHLGNDAGGEPHHANLSGYARFAGTKTSLMDPSDYYSWPKNVDGTVSTCTTYATTDNVDEALAWISTAPEPWFCYLAFTAPHSPFHAPPPDLHTRTLPPVDPRIDPRPFYEAMVEAMDTELGRLLNGIAADLPDTNVVFLGDNGTPREVCLPPFLPDHAKLTVYEGGINVPLIVTGPAVVHRGVECAALVNTTDLFATVLELGGFDLSTTKVPRDSVSLTPYLADPATPDRRRWVYSEIFTPNGSGPVLSGRLAIRDSRYKLIRTVNDALPDELYDLELDPFESIDLLAPGQPPLSGAAWWAYFVLGRQLTGMPWGVATFLP